MRAVNRLSGGATPKTILADMNNDKVLAGLTIAHVKSHLQMYRTGQINAQGMPVRGCDLVQFEPISKKLRRITRNEELDASMALQLLRKGGNFPAAETNNIAVDGRGFLRGTEGKAGDEIELDLTLATKSPKLKFPNPSTLKEDTSLSLGLSVGV